MTWSCWPPLAKTYSSSEAAGMKISSSKSPPSGGVPGMSHWEEAQDTAQDTLEGLCLLASLGTPWAPPGGGVWGEGSLGVSTESAAPATRSRMTWKTSLRTNSTGLDS
ncbi:hypothetical protein ATANTOWER_011159 [Ataeniobius toweri]|uniref:Uncharacterized protein n=1 Tax=Ataeniobius toweri TaxID=208326 RepID=A0ABU7ANW5_9TELE|nr:hypothetical protein [Ataeniobius toweri]